MSILTVKEALVILREHHVTNSEQVLRRWLREGRIPGERHDRKSGWRIQSESIYGFLLEFKEEGTPYETGLDDATRVQRFIKEVAELRQQLDELYKENTELRQRLGEQAF